jgi:DNA-binding XRE family transcriptional regulator
MRKIQGSLDVNRLKDVREELLISKAELARKAEISPLTIERIEKGTRSFRRADSSKKAKNIRVYSIRYDFYSGVFVTLKKFHPGVKGGKKKIK